MDILSWLEPSIIKRIDDVTEEMEKNATALNAEFKRNFDIIRSRYPESVNELLSMESCFARRSEIIEAAYRIGLEDGISLKALK